MNINNKKLILDCAEEMFCLHGYKETSVRSITERANTSVAMLNYYFKSKENLLVVVIERKMQQISKFKEELNTKNKNDFDELLIYCCFYSDLVIENLPFYRLIWKEKIFNKNKQVVKLISLFFKSHTETLRNIIVQGNANNLITSTDIDIFLITFSGFLNYHIFEIEGIYHFFDSENKEKIKEFTERILNSFNLDSLQKSKESHSK